MSIPGFRSLQSTKSKRCASIDSSKVSSVAVKWQPMQSREPTPNGKKVEFR
jgi:hypothetical protein